MSSRLDARLRVTALAIALAVGGCGDPVSPPEATKITVSPSSAALQSLGETVGLTATVLDQNGNVMTDVAVTWSSRNNEVATVDAAGLVTAVAGGTVMVQAATGTVTGTAEVRVDQTPVEVRVSPEADTVTALGDTVRLSAEAFDANGYAVADAVFEWSSDDESVVTVDGGGLVTAAGPGGARVTAEIRGVAGSAEVVVDQTPVEVRVSPGADTLTALGDTVRLSAEAFDANGHAVADAVFEWTSGDESVATVDAEGVVTAVGRGVVRVTAETRGVSGSAEVVVDQMPVEVRVSPGADTLTALGDTVRLSAEAFDANGHGVADAVFEWSSEDESVGTVDAEGLVTAVGRGVVRVTAETRGVSGSAEVVVDQMPVEVRVSPRADTLTALGDTVRLSADAFDANGHLVPETEFRWASDDTLVVTVDPMGLAAAVANGSAEVVATVGVDGVAGSAALTVAQRAAELHVSPVTDTLVAPDTLRLSAEAFDANGHSVAEIEFRWSSGDESVATVDAGGLVTVVGAGSVVVTVAESTADLEETVSLLVWGTREELIRMYEALGGEGWTKAQNWGTDAPLDEWYGVTTDGAGRIIELRLGNNGLAGPIPPELGRLESLRSLDLGYNRLLTGPVPPELGNLSNLDTLDLQVTGLSGSIPPELGNLSSLEYLNLYALGLSGSIPPELGNLSNLEFLSLGGWELSGSIPPELGDLSNLVHLHIQNTGLSGSIPPELGKKLSNLKALNLYGNDLSGPIPPELGELESLEHLSLAGNGLSGPIPPELGELSNLEDLSLYFNRLSDSIPTELADLSNLNTLWLVSNDLSGPIPPELGELESLEYLSLAENGLSGPIPPELGELSNLKDLRLNNAKLSGSIPPELGNLSNLTYLLVHNNDGLSGPLPLALDGLPLTKLHYHTTNLCAPEDASFQTWLNGIDDHSGTEDCVRRLTRGRWPRWSPDGEKIAFSFDRDGNWNWEIYVMDADGSDQTRLTNDGEWGFRHEWSPDGRKIAFESSRDGGDRDIYVMDADGSDQTRLTNDSEDDWGPEWSPDGEKIAFRSYRDGNWEIYVMDADGSNQTRLTNDGEVDCCPEWSPDGEKIAFESSRDGGDRDIYVMDADGSDQTRLTNDGDSDGIFAWSPDGEKIAFGSKRDGIYVMDADGSDQTRLTNDGEVDCCPEWSPDGEKIAFDSKRDGNWQIYVMDADGSNQTRLTNNRDSDVISAWSPDGTEIAFTRYGVGVYIYILQIK